MKIQYKNKVLSIKIGDITRLFGKVYKPAWKVRIDNLKTDLREEEIEYDQDFDSLPSNIEDLKLQEHDQKGYTLSTEKEAKNLIHHVEELREQLDYKRAHCKHVWGKPYQNYSWGGLQAGILVKCESCGEVKVISKSAWLAEYCKPGDGKDSFIINKKVISLEELEKKYHLTVKELMEKGEVLGNNSYGGKSVLLKEESSRREPTEFGMVAHITVQSYIIELNGNDEVVEVGQN